VGSEGHSIVKKLQVESKRKTAASAIGTSLTWRGELAVVAAEEE
jgi:hypothetical protein